VHKSTRIRGENGYTRPAALVGAAPATVGYHLGIARRIDAGLGAAHETAAGTAHLLASSYPINRSMARMGSYAI
jgi:hypothetical protein